MQDSEAEAIAEKVVNKLFLYVIGGFLGITAVEIGFEATVGWLIVLVPAYLFFLLLRRLCSKSKIKETK